MVNRERNIWCNPTLHCDCRAVVQEEHPGASNLGHTLHNRRQNKVACKPAEGPQQVTAGEGLDGRQAFGLYALLCYST